MNQPQLRDALNDCIDRLAEGQSIEDCLSTYPELADELSPLLEVGQASRLNRADNYELEQMHRRLDPQIEQLIQSTDFRSPPPFRLPQGIPVLAASLVIVFFGVMVFMTVNKIQNTVGLTLTPEVTESLTATATLESSATITASITPSPTATSNSTATASITPSLTSAPGLIPNNTPEAETNDCLVPEGWVEYKLQAGDTLSWIAVNSGASIEQLRIANCLDEASFIVEGSRFYVPQLWETVESNSSSGNDNDSSGSSSGRGHGSNSIDDGDDDDSDDDDSDDDKRDDDSDDD